MEENSAEGSHEFREDAANLQGLPVEPVLLKRWCAHRFTGAALTGEAECLFWLYTLQELQINKPDSFWPLAFPQARGQASGEAHAP